MSSDGSSSVSPAIVDGHLAQHLAHDDLDVLVADRHALGSVHLLDLGDQEALDGVHALDLEQLLRVERALGQRVTGLDDVAVGHAQARRVRHRVLADVDLLDVEGQRVALLRDPADGRRLDLDEILALARTGQQLALGHLVAVRDEDLVLRGELEGRVVGLAMRDAHRDRLVAGGRRHLDGAVDLGHDRLALGDARLEELLDARQALGDVLAGDAAGVERPHRQLRARLADRLGRDDADRLADVDEVAGGQVAAVAHPAHAVARGAGER